VQRAIDLGVNYFDTAVMYCNHESEKALGEAIKDKRDNLWISTKNHYKGDDPAEWRNYLDQSLERLGVDYIDFYHLHGLKLEEYEDHLLPNGSMGEAHRALDEGLIKHLCFSCHDDPKNIIKLIDTGEFEGILVQYNLFDRHNEEVIEYAHLKGLGVSIMGTVGGGQLIPMGQKIKGEGEPSAPELSIRFVLSNPGVTSALSGMNSVQMVEENATAASKPDPLQLEEMERIKMVMEEIQRLQGLYCTGCNYCMPCPSGVDIPANFTAFNLYNVWGLEGQAKIQYKALGDRKEEGDPVPAWAEACTECHTCEGKCPQEIDIPTKLKQVKAIYRGQTK
jgi:predicted aldo/keto reductase-like oxidoreductase